GSFDVTRVTLNRPHIDSAKLSASNLIISGSGGVTNATYFVLTSTNVAMSLTNWTMQATNVFDGSGHFVFTNAISPAAPQRFYVVKVP
ncbi:MAG: hypothetical protein M3Y82_14495, partial [Verrucomicrobiota bacterium]|nr:hypothetical protein [Verrucomicrobiota bacterium]